MPDLVDRAHRCLHVERHLRDRVRVVPPRGMGTPANHVTVADRLDLLEPMALGEHIEMAEQVVEDADHPVGGRRSASGVKSTTSANRIDAEPNWSAIGCVSALSLSAIDAGRMLSSRLSALACSARNAASAFRRWSAKTASSVNTIVPPTITLRASIVLVNHSGTAGDTPTEQLSGDPGAEEYDEVRDVPEPRSERR